MKHLLWLIFLLSACSGWSSLGAKQKRDAGQEPEPVDEMIDPPMAKVTPATLTNGKYTMICRIDAQPVRFRAEIYEAGSTQYVELSPLKKNASSAFESLEREAFELTVEEGVAVAHLGRYALPREADREIVLEDMRLVLSFRGGLCGEVEGRVVSPSAVDLGGKGDVCVRRPIADQEGRVVMPEPKDFVCP
jgi:hypothetical protein